MTSWNFTRPGRPRPAPARSHLRHPGVFPLEQDRLPAMSPTQMIFWLPARGGRTVPSVRALALSLGLLRVAGIFVGVLCVSVMAFVSELDPRATAAPLFCSRYRLRCLRLKLDRRAALCVRFFRRGLVYLLLREALAGPGWYGTGACDLQAFIGCDSGGDDVLGACWRMFAGLSGSSGLMILGSMATAGVNGFWLWIARLRVFSRFRHQQ